MSDLSQLNSDKNIGDMLRTRREELGLSLEEVSERLRIRLFFLKALEEGRIEQLPGVAYASGFLRAYAELLKLDSDALVKHFRQENQAHPQKTELMFPAPVPQSGIPAGVIILFSFIIMVGAYVGWYKLSDHQQSLSETIPAPPANIKDKKAPPEQVSPQIASIMPSPPPVSEAENTKPASEVNNTDKNQINDSQLNDFPSTPLTDSLHPESMDQVQQSPVIQQQPTAPVADMPKPALPLENQKPEQPLMIKAIAPSWLQVKDKAGKVLFQKVLKTDEVWQIPSDQDEVVMTIGNPGFVVLQKGDIQSSPLGKKGRTLRRFVLNNEKADQLLRPVDEDNNAPSEDTMPQEEKKKATVYRKPSVPSKHDVSADELNAKQLNH